MKIKYILFLFIAFVFCSALKQTENTLTGNWTLVCYEDLTLGKIECRATDFPYKGTLVFDFKDNGISGMFTGKTHTNNVSGKYKIFDNNKITVERFGGTKIGESCWGRKFWTTIKQSSSFNYVNDTLVIFYDNDTKAMKFIKTELE